MSVVVEACPRFIVVYVQNNTKWLVKHGRWELCVKLTVSQLTTGLLRPSQVFWAMLTGNSAQWTQTFPFLQPGVYNHYNQEVHTVY